MPIIYNITKNYFPAIVNERFFFNVFIRGINVFNFCVFSLAFHQLSFQLWLLVNLRTNQIADNRIADWLTRGLVWSRTLWSTRGLVLCLRKYSVCYIKQWLGLNWNTPTQFGILNNKEDIEIIEKVQTRKLRGQFKNN